MTPLELVERLVLSEKVHLAVVNGPTRTDQFLDAIADRLVHFHGEPENIDFVWRLRDMAKRLKKAFDEA